MHKIATIRKGIDYTQAQFGGLIGRSRPTVQAIELGKLRLTEELAQKVSEETGVSLKWLLEEDPDTEPYSEMGAGHAPWNREIFEHIQASKHPVHFVRSQGQVDSAAIAIESIIDWLPIFSAATKTGKNYLALYHLSKFLRDMRNKFGEDRPEAPAKLSIKYHLEEQGSEAESTMLVYVHAHGGIQVNIRPFDPNIDPVDYID